VLALSRDQEVPVYATKAVAGMIEQVADAKRAQWSPVYGDEWPAETHYPNSLLADGNKQLPEAARSELDAAMRAFLPDAPLTWMIELGADAVAAELAAGTQAAE
jgi:hypothetical protein